MKRLHIRNQQRARRINRRLLERIIRELLEEAGVETYEISIQLIACSKMASLNEEYLQHAGSTDVITFDYSKGYEELGEENRGLAGEIFISTEDTVRQADEYGTAWTEELVRYVIHGILHLSGYDDKVAAKRKVMKQKENQLLEMISGRHKIRNLGR